MESLDLGGEWKVKAAERNEHIPVAARKVLRWTKAAVPGTVHTDLMAAGIIPDPYVAMNELNVQWVESVPWIYRKEFTVPADFLRHKRIVLVAEGLDTFARLTCNGRTVGESANMFISHRWDIRKFLRTGRNILEITFDSPVERARKLEKDHGKLNVALEPHRVYTRKAQYSYSWDWGPKLTTSGIWRPIRLEAFDAGELRDPVVRVLEATARRAVIDVSVDVARYARGPLSVRVYIAGRDAVVERVLAVPGGTARCRVVIPSPDLWWPNGYGEQPMYTALFTLLSGDSEVHQAEVRFGVRVVKLLQERDDEGRSFIFEVNGIRIFAKGADWIPSDNFLPRIPESTYERLLSSARSASMNMIRVWGGGVYESDLFYDLCDRLGLMVWQDFMYACGEYPQYREFVRDARKEAEQVVKRLRNHPSLAIWCGNNECEWLYCTEHPGAPPDDMSGAVIFRDVLAEVVRQEDGTRPYWRSSPFGAGFPNDERTGNHHQWIVWSFWKDYREYEKDHARFVTEFGFQAPANRRTLEDVIPARERYPQSPMMEHHNKQVEGTERLIRFQASHVKVAEDFEDFVYKGQFIQGEALKTAVEHWRRRKFKTAGVMFWQLNDCWPVSSWSVIDSALRPKAGYYYARRFYAPLLVSLKRETYGVSVWVTNDTLGAYAGTLVVSLRTFDGTVHWMKSTKLQIPGNTSRRIELIDRHRLQVVKPLEEYLYASLGEDGSPVSENRFFFAEPKHTHLPPAGLKAVVKGGESLMVEVRTQKFARAVYLEGEDGRTIFEDNFFDLEPGESKSVRVTSDTTPQALRRTLRVRSLR